MSCPECHTPVPAEARFCPACGVSLEAPEPAEHKQATILFVDVVGSMPHEEALDAEHWRAWLDRFYATTATVVGRFRGSVNGWTGDGLRALFGAPLADEDHALHACLAALEIHAAMPALAADPALAGRALDIRIGLNSGDVIAGRNDAAYTASGHAIGMARRMEALAPHGSTVLSESTARLVAGRVALRSLGTFSVKGATTPQTIHELLGTTDGPAATDGIFVGRSSELQAIDAAFAAAVAGDPGEILCLVGDPGIGKTRLVGAALERAAAEGMTVYRGGGFSHGQESPLSGALNLVRDFLGIRAVVNTDDALAIVRDRVRALDPALEPDLSVLLSFLGLGEAAPELDPAARQRALLRVVARLVRAQGEQAPALYVLEDLHWLDAASEVFLDAFAEALGGTAAVTVATYRPEYAAAALQRSHCRHVELQPLSDAAIRELLLGLLGDDASLPAAVDLIVRRVAGNPFFCHELVRQLRGTGHLDGPAGRHRLVRPLDASVVPATVHATLAARIDRLGAPAKGLLQDASVLGLRGSLSLLAVVSERSADAVSETVAELAAASLLVPVPGPEPHYAFAHPLARDVAYQSQLRARRTAVHARAVGALQTLYADGLDEHAGAIAHHAAEAGDPATAAGAHARAGVWVGRSDSRAALAHWRQARDLADSLPDDHGARDGLRLGARLGFLSTFWRVGIDPVEVDEAYGVARALLMAQPGTDELLLRIEWGRLASRMLAGRIPEAMADGPAVVERVRATGDRAMEASFTSGLAYLQHLAGRFAEAIETATTVLDLANGDVTLGAGVNYQLPVVHAQDFRAYFRCLTGDVAGGMADWDAAERIAEAQGDPETLSWICSKRAIVHAALGEAEAAAADSRRGLELAERSSGFAMLVARASTAAARIAEGDWDGAEAAVDAAKAQFAVSHVRPELDAWLDEHLAAIAHARGDHAGSAALARGALTRAGGYGYPMGELTAALALGRAQAALGELEAARRALAIADARIAQTGIVLHDAARDALAEDLRSAMNVA